MKHKEIGKRIHERRSEVNVSAAELAERLSMSKATIHRYESGEIKRIKLPVIESIARELRCNPSWLLGKSEIKEERKVTWRDDVAVLLHEIAEYIGSRSGLKCNGSPLSEDDRSMLVHGLDILRRSVSK